MPALIAGGGSGAVASSAHAGCERFRMTDPLLTGKSRRALAATLRAPDTTGTIPTARWVRAMAFERMVHDPSFVSELLTRAVGLLRLERPDGVRVRSGHDAVDTTADELAGAHLKAKHAGEATMLFGLRVPFVGLEDLSRATDVRPDFAIVAPRFDGTRRVGSWLVMGDAKDYERVRARIDDGRLLKGFLQVALGAESAAGWSRLPAGMEVHRFGALAVPRNAYLRPEAVVEDLADHRTEVRGRVEERIAALRALDLVPASADELRAHVEHLPATYDPTSCASCSLYAHCRAQLRGSGDPADLVVELGIPTVHRPALVDLIVHGVEPSASTPRSITAAVEATLTGLPLKSDRARVDPVGLPGCIHVLLAKSDSAALGVHGVAVQRLDGSRSEPWEFRVFERTNATETRHTIMELLGREIETVLVRGDGPVHLVVPDQATADVLVSIADSLAGVELSRLRWQRDLDEGREMLTFDGEPATMPAPLSEQARVAVSLLLEDDRARAFSLRQPIVDLRAVLASHVVAGGPGSDSGRLDYVVRWAEATAPLDHRAVTDEIASSLHTPGARLSNALSDAVHEAGRPGKGDPVLYDKLVTDALEYRIDVMLRAVAALEAMPHSRLRAAHRALEHDAQVVWGRRLALQASDLVRFSRTYRYWRNAQVDMLDADRKCRDQFGALVDGRVAHDRAADAGVQDLALAEVVSVAPVRLVVRSRRLGAGERVALLHTPAGPVAEQPAVSLAVQAGSFKLGQVPIAVLADPEDDQPGLLWEPVAPAGLAVGDLVVLGRADWFSKAFKSGHELAVTRPSLDRLAAPNADCTPSSYAVDPKGHAWCCRPHEAAEAEWSDTIAERRAKGELNPHVWPPLVDQERFDLGADDAPDLDTIDVPAMPDDLTIDDLP